VPGTQGGWAEKNQKSTFKTNGTKADLAHVNLIVSFDSTPTVGRADTAKDSARRDGRDDVPTVAELRGSAGARGQGGLEFQDTTRRAERGAAERGAPNPVTGRPGVPWRVRPSCHGTVGGGPGRG
jgi:hypothetical protein